MITFGKSSISNLIISTFLRGNQLHLQEASTTLKQSDDDVVIVAAVRTAIAKANRGYFKDTSTDLILGSVLKEVVKRGNIDPSIVGDICCGNVGNQNFSVNARVAQSFAGIPLSVPLYTVNRQCSSGLEAVADIARSIKTGTIEIGIACGCEAMTEEVPTWKPRLHYDGIYSSEEGRQLMTRMGDSSDNVAKEYSVSREDQDHFAYLSHVKAAKAIKEGKFVEEIVPVTVTLIDGENEKQVEFKVDECVRGDTSVAGLKKLKPYFNKESGSTTAGNSSQRSDGAAAVLMMSRKKAKSLGLPIMGVMRSYAVRGVRPDIMGVGPKFAIPPALHAAGVTVKDVDVFEINEAFASQALYCINELKIPLEKCNPNGGAIALGHPLGATGTRQLVSLLYEMKRKPESSLGVVSMCIGTGMGAAGVFSRN